MSTFGTINNLNGVNLVNFYNEIFLPLCASTGKKPTVVAQDLGFSRSVVSNWKIRGSFPTDTTLVRIADYFGVSVDSLKGKKEQPIQEDGLSDVKQMLKGMIPDLSEDTASMLLILAKQLTAKDKSTGSHQ